MNKHEAQLTLYMFVYLGLLVGSLIAIFFPFQVIESTSEILLQVETVGFYAIIGIFLQIAGFIIYCFQIWLDRKILRNLGFGIGLAGSIESTIFGFFGFFYFYYAIRYNSILLPGAITSGILYLATIVFIGLIYIKICTIDEEKIDNEIVYID